MKKLLKYDYYLHKDRERAEPCKFDLATRVHSTPSPSAECSGLILVSGKLEQNRKGMNRANKYDCK